MIPQNAKTTAFGHGSSLKTGFRSGPAPLMTSSSTIAPSESLSLVSQAALLYTRGEELLLQNSSASLAEGAPLIESAAQLGYLPAQVILFALYAWIFLSDFELLAKKRPCMDSVLNLGLDSIKTFKRQRISISRLQCKEMDWVCLIELVVTFL